ncbi:FAD-dependent oxidoreductase [Isoptericola halotolerans]|uniref:NAD(P)/FAD-dependent oxidoreductase n=1 Tax=Isoptericola halotolerans TaxID=300560 RepID=UPI0038905CF1
MRPERRLLLVGAGHAHLHLLRHAPRLAGAGYQVCLVAPRWFDYSGLAAAIAAGGHDPHEGRIDVGALARHAAVDHLRGMVVDVDPVARTASTDGGDRLTWDIVSFNIGSVTTADASTQIAAGTAGTVGVKPLDGLARLREHLAGRPSGNGHRITVVGGGASGIELAAHLGARHDVDRVHLIESGDHVGGFLPPSARTRVLVLLEERGVRVRTGAQIELLDRTSVRLRDGTRWTHDLAVLASGLSAPALARRAPLGGLDGFPVRATLQHRDDDDVYAVGDCADFLPASLPRTGVHGVRQGPVLLSAFEARARGDRRPVYRPPRRTLSILDLGGGTALAVRGRRWWLGRSSLTVKRRIDRRWLARYRDGGSSPTAPGS